MIATNSDNNFLLGEVRISPSHNQLAAQGKSVVLQPKVMAVLHYLARHQERVVSSEELLEQLWKGRIVTPGSVQKSINSLRKALAEFFGDQELIAHYSKRGYQLVLAPIFLEPEPSLPGAEGVVPARLGSRSSRLSPWTLVTIASIAVFVVISLIWLKLSAPASIQVDRHHKILFMTVSEYTSDSAHERDAEPHPVNRHLAFVRERLIARDKWEIDSQLMIRNDKGEDWQIASSQGSWVSLAWSPDGQHLAAIEIWRQEGLPPTPNFFEQANYLYTFHIFSLDLERNRLLEKHLLSQWQGRIASVTWWDETTLEFVAAQGPGARQERYRYAIFEQQLSVVDSPRSQADPLLTAVMHQRTALASAHKHQIKIDLIDEHQNSHASWLLDHPWLDISWIPDGSGILVFAEEQQRLLVLYWNGQRQEIPLNSRLDRQISRPRYRPDGQAIYYTEKKSQSRIDWLSEMPEKNPATHHLDNALSAVFAPDGERLVHASVRDNEVHLWLLDEAGERRLTRMPIERKPDRLVWSGDGGQVVYQVGKRILFYDLSAGLETSLRLESASMEPLAFDVQHQLLYVMRSQGDVNNLWSIDVQSLQQKRLTFGALGSVTEHRGDMYFQYLNKPGLWVLRQGEAKPEVIAQRLEENSLLLALDDTGVYYLTGGHCRESDIYHLDLRTGEKTTYLARSSRLVATHSFHPTAGLLQQPCQLSDANILMLE